MKLDLLFDIHSFIWWADEPKKLSRAALAALEDENNRLFLRIAQELDRLKAEAGQNRER